ncbi:MAG: hypothetical protein ACP5GJ_00985 [Nanopusillaceae archaeon]|jgi:uncharacterized protein (UPF0333 family)
MKNQEMPVSLTFLIIIGIIVTLTIIGIIYYFKGNITSFINHTLPKYNNTQTIVETNVSSIDTIALDIISCYEKKENGLCYLISYQGKSFTCQDLINLVNQINPSVVMQNCNYTINSGDYILVYSTGEYVYIQLQG